MLNWFWSNRLKNSDLSLLILRIVGGGFMLTHGFPKFQRLLEGNFKFGDPIGLGSELSFVLVVFAEFFCSILIILGLKSRVASLFLMFTMAVAAFIAHADDPIGKKELPLIYFAIFFVIFLSGSGKYSLDEKI